MSASDDKVRVPIEIDPEDMGELNDLIQRIKDAFPDTDAGIADMEEFMKWYTSF